MYLQSADQIVKQVNTIETFILVISIISLLAILAALCVAAAALYYSVMKKAHVEVTPLLDLDDLEVVPGRPRSRMPVKFDLVVPIKIINIGNSPAAVYFIKWELERPEGIDIRCEVAWKNGEVYHVLEPREQTIQDLNVRFDLQTSAGAGYVSKVAEKLKTLEEAVEKQEFNVYINYLTAEIGMKHGFVKIESLTVDLTPIILKAKSALHQKLEVTS